MAVCIHGLQVPLHSSLLWLCFSRALTVTLCWDSNCLRQAMLPS